MCMWMVRAERDGSLFQPFIERGVVAIGWSELGDLSQILNRSAIVSKLKQKFPDRPDMAHSVAAGVLYRFSRKMEVGDDVVSYDRTRRIYAVGKLKGEYEYDPTFNPKFPNVRRVDWKEEKISRDSLLTATKNSLGSVMTLFLLPKQAAEDIWRSVNGKQVDPTDGETTEVEDATLLLEDLESKSIEFIEDGIVRLDWQGAQTLVAGMLRALGYKTRVSEAGPDRGVDIVASKDGLGFENPRIVVEVKHRKGQIGARDIRSFLGGRHINDKCLYVSTGGFSKEARYEADRANVILTLLDLQDLAKKFVEIYGALDEETRNLVPLRRIYWPVRQE